MSRELAQRLLQLSPEAQERRVLDVLLYHDVGLTRDWFCVELRPAFDRLIWKGLIAPENKFRATAAGKALDRIDPTPEPKP